MSAESHQAEVTMISADTPDGSFFSVGKDGFLIKWTPDGFGEHYQLTELEIRLVAVRPNGYDIAVYETDGYSVHRVSVWNWKNLTRRFVKTFSSSITALSFTEKGTLLAVGTATVNGAVYINPMTGNTVSKIKEATGIVNMIQGSSTEKSTVMYSPAGHLSYYNMTNGTRKERFQTEQQLEQVVLFNNNLFCAGVKNDQIYIIESLSGKTVARLAAKSPVLFNDPEDTVLYYTEFDGRTYTLKQVTATYDGTTSSVGSPTLVKTLTGLSSRDPVSCTAKKDSTLLLGTGNGNIYSTDTANSALVSITNKEYDKIQTLSNALVNAHNQLKDKNNKIKTLTENNETLNLRVKTLNDIIKEKDNEISFLKSKINDLKNTIEYWKDKFEKLISFLHDKLHSWYDKDDKYIDVVNDMYDDNVLDDDYIEELDLSKEKDDYER